MVGVVIMAVVVLMVAVVVVVMIVTTFKSIGPDIIIVTDRFKH